jgi:hypothetical protein
MTYMGVRCSGAAAHKHDSHSSKGHHDEHHGHAAEQFDQSKSVNTQFKIPTQADIDYQLPKKGMFNEKFSQWIAARWPVDRDDTL